MRIAASATAALLAGSGLLACRVGTDPGDARACQQTYEFGNNGCLEVSGQVVDRRGLPLTAIDVGLRHLPQSQIFLGGHARTDVSGSFSFRVSRMTGGAPATGPDTVSLWVHAVDSRSAGVNRPATVQDSVLVLATISPVGTIPTAASVRLTLPVP